MNPHSITDLTPPQDRADRGRRARIRHSVDLAIFEKQPGWKIQTISDV